MPRIETFLGEPGCPAAPPPGYFEGYPRIAFTELRSAIGEGRSLCAFVHPTGSNRGHAYAVMRGGRIELSYFIKPFYGEPSRKRACTIDLQNVQLGQGRKRTMMVCPKCCKPTATLIFFQGWSCRKDLTLYYRSIKTTRLARMRRREQDLRAETEAGPVYRKHIASFVNKLEELDNIKAQLDKGNRRKIIQTTERHIIDAVWIDPADDIGLADYTPGSNFNPAFETAIAADRRLGHR